MQYKGFDVNVQHPLLDVRQPRLAAIRCTIIHIFLCEEQCRHANQTSRSTRRHVSSFSNSVLGNICTDTVTLPRYQMIVLRRQLLWQMRSMRSVGPAHISVWRGTARLRQSFIPFQWVLTLILSILRDSFYYMNGSWTSCGSAVLHTLRTELSVHYRTCVAHKHHHHDGFWEWYTEQNFYGTFLQILYCWSFLAPADDQGWSINFSSCGKINVFWSPLICGLTRSFLRLVARLVAWTTSCWIEPVFPPVSKPAQ